MLAECLDLSFHLQPGWFWLMFVILGSWWITLPPRLPSATRKFSHTRRGKHQFHQQWCCNLFFWALVIAISGNWGNWGNEPWYWCTSGIDSLIPSFPMSRTSYFLPKYIPPAKCPESGNEMGWEPGNCSAWRNGWLGYGWRPADSSHHLRKLQGQSFQMRVAFACCIVRLSSVNLYTFSMSWARFLLWDIMSGARDHPGDLQTNVLLSMNPDIFPCSFAERLGLRIHKSLILSQGSTRAWLRTSSLRPVAISRISWWLFWSALTPEHLLTTTRIAKTWRQQWMEWGPMKKQSFRSWLARPQRKSRLWKPSTKKNLERTCMPASMMRPGIGAWVCLLGKTSEPPCLAWCGSQQNDLRVQFAIAWLVGAQMTLAWSLCWCIFPSGNAVIWSPSTVTSKMVEICTKPLKLTPVVTTSELCLPWWSLLRRSGLKQLWVPWRAWALQTICWSTGCALQKKGWMRSVSTLKPWTVVDWPSGLMATVAMQITRSIWEHCQESIYRTIESQVLFCWVHPGQFLPRLFSFPGQYLLSAVHAEFTLSPLHNSRCKYPRMPS